MMSKHLTKLAVQGALASSALLSCLASATIVQFQTSLGNFEVNLYDEATPETVANFLDYIEAGAYNDTFIHRSVAGFIVQGGGFMLDDDNKVQRIETPLSPPNEPVYSNVRGSIAMAKQRNDPDSATSQWFVNLADNSADLDPQNGGFTVFGEVVASGMEVVDAIAALPKFKIDDEAFTTTPLRNYTDGSAEDFNANPGDYLMMIDAIVVIDAAADTAEGLTPTPNTLITNPPEEPPPAPVRKKKGGMIDWLALLALAGAGSAAGILRRR